MVTGTTPRPFVTTGFATTSTTTTSDNQVLNF
jgi:hypothetical protein